MHKNLLKNLLLQGLIKLMEGKIKIMCREEDVELIEAVKDEAVEEYRKMMVSEVIALQSKSPEDIPCEIVIRTDKYLPSYDAEKKSGYIGGFIMTAKKDKITLQQTLDDRVKLCQEIAVPTIRYMLFPAMRAKKWASSVYKEHCIII